MTGPAWFAAVTSLLAWLYVFRRCLHLKALVSDLTLLAAWKWTVAAILAEAGLLAARIALPAMPRQTDSAAQYLVVTLTMVPLIVVLGARRPGQRAWPWFVVVPLIAVLQWSALTELVAGRDTVPVEIPTPTIIGWLFVLLMGGGNYVGTRLTFAALLAGSGMICLLLPVTEWIAFPGGGFTLAGSLLLAASAARVSARFSGSMEMGQPSGGTRGSEPPVNVLWADFRDLYGMVWARRVVDRVNQFAAREQWDVALTTDGFRALQGDQTQVGAASSLDRATQVLCWVLRRFCDDAFFSRYLRNVPRQAEAPPAANSSAPISGPRRI